jgi:hypothetical protein
MDAQQARAPERLFKRQAALRATLSDDESALLDRFIITSAVSAHIVAPDVRRTIARGRQRRRPYA